MQNAQFKNLNFSAGMQEEFLYILIDLQIGKCREKQRIFI